MRNKLNVYVERVAREHFGLEINCCQARDIINTINKYAKNSSFEYELFILLHYIEIEYRKQK